MVGQAKEQVENVKMCVSRRVPPGTWCRSPLPLIAVGGFLPRAFLSSLRRTSLVARSFSFLGRRCKLKIEMGTHCLSLLGSLLEVKKVKLTACRSSVVTKLKYKTIISACCSTVVHQLRRKYEKQIPI